MALFAKFRWCVWITSMHFFYSNAWCYMMKKSVVRKHHLKITELKKIINQPNIVTTNVCFVYQYTLEHGKQSDVSWLKLTYSLLNKIRTDTCTTTHIYQWFHRTITKCIRTRNTFIWVHYVGILLRRNEGPTPSWWLQMSWHQIDRQPSYIIYKRFWAWWFVAVWN